MNLSKADKSEVINRYKKRYQLYGYSPKTLGWDKGKQYIRFEVLTSEYNFDNKKVLDIGCGFGDLNRTLAANYKNYKYLGIDLVDDLIEYAEKTYVGKDIKFVSGDFLAKDFSEKFDYAIASGMFNFKLQNNKNYEFIESVISKAIFLCTDGVAFDFLSDKVDYKYKHTFHSNPGKILNIAYKFSRNIIIRNDYMPFEFSLFIFKDDSFKKADTVFSRYKRIRNIKGIIRE